MRKEKVKSGQRPGCLKKRMMGPSVLAALRGGGVKRILRNIPGGRERAGNSSHEVGAVWKKRSTGRLRSTQSENGGGKDNFYTDGGKDRRGGLGDVAVNLPWYFVDCVEKAPSGKMALVT